MDYQIVIVAIIILAAIVYVGRSVWRKTKNFSSKSSCGAGCGCASESKRKA